MKKYRKPQLKPSLPDDAHDGTKKTKRLGKKLWAVEWRRTPDAYDRMCRNGLFGKQRENNWKVYKKYDSELKRDQAFEQLTKNSAGWGFWEYRKVSL